MSLQHMALFDAITRPGARVFHLSHNSLDRLTPLELGKFKDAKRVWVDESLHQRLDFTPSQVDFTKDFGELRLPFPHIWLEWVNLRRRTSHIVDKGDAVHMALQCFEVAPQRKNEFSWLAVPWMFAPATNENGMGGYPAEYDQIFRIDFDESGQTIGVSGYSRTFGNVSPLPECTPENRNENDLAALIDLCWNGLVAIGFMNCKNVATVRHDRTPKATKKQRRKRPPKLDYHTIVLPGSPHASGGGSGQKQDVMPLHHVRGHFKTFTAERHLMGKHTGTYWWGCQMRGSKKNGLVVSDYKVGA